MQSRDLKQKRSEYDQNKRVAAAGTIAIVLAVALITLSGCVMSNADAERAENIAANFAGMTFEGKSKEKTSDGS